MNATEVTVGIPVANLPRSRQWYESLLGKAPELEPVPGIVEFKVAGMWLQLAEGKPTKSDWTLRMGVSDLSGEKRRLTGLGIKTTDVQTVPGLISFFGFKELDGNNLSFYQLL